jgi:hypothetical protein
MMSSDIKLSPINDGWFDVPYIDGTASFDSVKCQLISSMFAHGGCHARIISGPTFDEALALSPADVGGVVTPSAPDASTPAQRPRE